MITLSPGEADSEYKTSDKELVLGLLSLNHKPVRIEVDKSKDFPMIYYTFDQDMVEDDINRLMTNEEILVDIRMVWAANQVWTMNVRRAKYA